MTSFKKKVKARNMQRGALRLSVLMFELQRMVFNQKQFRQFVGGQMDITQIAPYLMSIFGSKDGAQAIAIYCTNFRGAGAAELIEAETGIPVLDSVSTALWKSMLVAGDDPARIRGWGRVFDV